MSAEPGDALDVLRAIWRSQGRSSADIDGGASENKSCKRMADAGVGFDDFATGNEDLAAAWQARLQREGKLDRSGGRIRDLVLGPADVH